MRFFNRRPVAADANTSASTGPTSREKHSRRTVMSSHDRRHKHRARDAYGDGMLNKRPSFGHWLKVTWPDVLTMLVMGVIGLGVRTHSHATQLESTDMTAGLRSSAGSLAKLSRLLHRRRSRLPGVRLPFAQGDHSHLGSRYARRAHPHRGHSLHADSHPQLLGRQQWGHRAAVLAHHGGSVPSLPEVAYRRTEAALSWCVTIAETY